MQAGRQLIGIVHPNESKKIAGIPVISPVNLIESEGKPDYFSFFSAIFRILSLIWGLFSMWCHSSRLIPRKNPQEEHLTHTSYWSGNSAFRVDFLHLGHTSVFFVVAIASE
jgi:hypothetical protein